MLVRESISFKRTGDAKSSLDIGEKYLLKKRLEELYNNEEHFIIRGIFSNWGEDVWVGADIQYMEGDIVDVRVYWEDEEDHDLISSDVSFNINNVEFIDEEMGSAYVKLKEPVTTSY